VANTTTGGFIADILDAIGYTEAPLRELDEGDSITVDAPNGTQNGLQQREALLEAERGVFYMSAGGVATYEDRSAIARRRVAQATITDGAVRSEPGFEIDRLINRQTVQRQDALDGDGIPQAATNAESLRTFGLNDGGTISTPFLETDLQAAGLARYLVNLKGKLREPLTVEVTGPAAYAVLGLDLQDRVTVQDDEAGTTGDYHIQRIEHNVTEFGLYHSIVFTLTPRGAEGFIIGADGAAPGSDDYGSVFGSTTDLITY
jgi:hypothetical protein